jgi:cytidylate kinase
MKITIAIDGHSSTGKSTVARQLANYLGYIYVDSGAMYRGVTLYALQKGWISDSHFEKKKLIGALSDIHLEFRKDNSKDKSELHLNGNNVEEQIRSMKVSEHVSQIAAIPEIRRKLVKLQHDIGLEKGVVMDGRDIGTVVFPDAELKIFMTANPETRASRRYKELCSKGDKITYEEVFENVKERDFLDSTRKDSPLRKADDAIVVDNSEMNVEDQFNIILQLAKDRIAGRV